MSEVFDVLKNMIAEIQQQQGYPPVSVQRETQLVADLGLQSLDIAQLIAMLENEFAVDPFAHGATLDAVRTAGELSELYGS